MTNEELVSLIQAGQLDKLLELWNQVEHNVYKAASKQAWDTRGFGGVTAKDLYQSGYIALVAAVNSYVPDEGCSFKTWLEFYIRKSFAEAGGFRTPKRALDPIHRADSLDAPLGDDENSRTLWEAAPDPGAAQDFQDAENRVWVEQLREALDRALDELPDGWAEILRRSYYAGHTKKQIAACLGIGDATVCRRKKKALHVLRQRQELRRFLQD